MTARPTIRQPIRTGNPPGLSELRFRLATQPVFQRWMLSRLAESTLLLRDGTQIANPLCGLNPNAADAFIPSLISAWAAIGDVLTFYQERIANEGYLATATEVLSVRELVSSVGYRPLPALSAQTHLAFTLIEGQGAPERRLAVPKGTAVRSVPLPGQSAVVFETTRDIEARGAWNAMTPLLPSPPALPAIAPGAIRMRVSGVAGDLRPGMPILLHGKRRAAEPASVVRELTSVDANASERSVMLGWRDPIDGPQFITPELFGFRTTAKLFGTGAPNWSRQSDAVKAQVATRAGDVATGSIEGDDWIVSNAGLPPTEVRALTLDGAGNLFAATDAAVLRLAPHAGWTTLGPVPRRLLTALIVAAPGVLYAGTQTGQILGSTDHGATWFNIAGAAQPGGVSGAAPSPIRTLTMVPPQSGVAAIAIGTLYGLWLMPTNGGPWTSWNDGLPGYDRKHGGAAAAINGLAQHPETGVWAAATDQGLFYAEHRGATWHPARHVSMRPPIAAPRPPTSPPPASPTATPVSPTPAAPMTPAPAASSGRLLGVLRHWWGAPQTVAAPQASGATTTALPSASDGAPDGGEGGDDGATAPPSDAAACVAVLVDEDAIATLFAGTADGVQRSPDGEDWTPAAPLEAGVRIAVTHLATDRGVLVAGTGRGLFVSRDGGDTWSRASGPFATAAVAVVAAGGGRIAAAAPFRGYRETEWPGLFVSGKTIDLDRAYTAPAPGSWIVLAQDDATQSGTRTFVPRRVVSTSVLQRSDFGLTSRVTRLLLDTPLGVAFNPRIATAFIDSRALDLLRRPEKPVVVLGVSADGTPEPPAPGVHAPQLALAGAIEDLSGQYIGISGRRARARLTGRAGGVRLLEGTQWTPVGAADHDGQALLFTADKQLWLGSKTGVFRLDGDEWAPVGDLDDSVLALAEAGDGTVLAGGQRGLKRLVGTTWTPCPFPGPARAVRALLTIDATRVVAGTDAGIYVSGEAGATWRAASGAVMAAAVNSLVRSGDGSIVAGTDRGIFVGTAADWSHAVATHREAVQALATAADGRLYAGGDGVFVSTDNGRSWQPDPALRLQGDIRAIAADPAGDEVYFARRGVGVVTRHAALPAGIANDVRTLLVGPDGHLYAGSWSSSALTSPDRKQVLAIEPRFVADVTIESEDLKALLIAGTLAPEVQRACAKNGVDLPPTGVVQAERSGAVWSVSGDSQPTYMLHAVGRDVLRVFVTNDLDVMALPTKAFDQTSLQEWRLRTSDGCEVVVNAVAAAPETPGDIDFTHADPKGKTVSEVGHIGVATIARDRSRTDIALAQPLAGAYDARTVMFNANVAPASHGETSALYEVIGSGDASKANQSFALRRKPVTALANETAPFYAFEITIRVRPSLPLEPVALSGELRPRAMAADSVEWQRVETLTASGPNDRHYELREDEAGNAVVTFGDGVNGMRLPTGAENVIALYRTGSGPAGNVGADTLTVPVRRPPGVRRISNPSAASGGTLPASPDEMRRNVLPQVRTPARIVSLRDYEDFIRAWPGIGKAAVRLLPVPNSRGHLIHATIAGSGLSDDLPDTAAILRAIADNCSHPHRVQIDACVPVHFQLEAEVAVQPDQQWNAVSRAVAAMLLARYGFAARELGEPVYAADIVARIQDVGGVHAVELRALHRRGRTASLHAMLLARAAHRTTGTQIRPAELLLIGGMDDIRLRPSE